jgi:chorismate mutase
MWRVTEPSAPPPVPPAEPPPERPPERPPEPPPEELLRLRASIDNIDAALVHLLAERFKCTQEVGKLKAALHLPPADPVREEAQIARLRALAHEAGLDPQFAEKFLGFIVAEVIRHHEDIAGSAARSTGRPR